jgi:hypothetical protein
MRPAMKSGCREAAMEVDVGLGPLDDNSASARIRGHRDVRFSPCTIELASSES